MPDAAPHSGEQLTLEAPQVRPGGLLEDPEIRERANAHWDEYEKAVSKGLRRLR
jgi:hypothetical protein